MSPKRAISLAPAAADHWRMSAHEVDALRARGEAALHEEVARAHDRRAARARQIGATADAETESGRAEAARSRARELIRGADDAGPLEPASV